jgi:hypothetical protein
MNFSKKVWAFLIIFSGLMFPNLEALSRTSGGLVRLSGNDRGNGLSPEEPPEERPGPDDLLPLQEIFCAYMERSLQSLDRIVKGMEAWDHDIHQKRGRIHQKAKEICDPESKIIYFESLPKGDADPAEKAMEIFSLESFQSWIPLVIQVNADSIGLDPEIFAQVQDLPEGDTLLTALALHALLSIEPIRIESPDCAEWSFLVWFYDRKLQKHEANSELFQCPGERCRNPFCPTHQMEYENQKMNFDIAAVMRREAISAPVFCYFEAGLSYGDLLRKF